MLKSALLHPEVLNALGSAGHGSKVLIADGNYPCSTTAGTNAQLVYLNLAPGMLSVTDVLSVLTQAIPIESVEVMQTADGSIPQIFAEFQELVGRKTALMPIERFAFYEAVSDPCVCLVIATGEQRVYANILLTIGVIPPPR